MYLTNHVSTVLLVSQLPINPVAALGLGLASHYLLDMVPHGDNLRRFKPPKLKESIADNPDYGALQLEGAIDIWAVVGVLAVVGSFAMIKQPFTFLFVIIGSVVPDFIMGVNSIWKTKWIHYHQLFHYWAHTLLPDVPYKLGRLGQVVYFMVVISIYFVFIG